jgi:hypothetical protein
VDTLTIQHNIIICVGWYHILFYVALSTFEHWHIHRYNTTHCSHGVNIQHLKFRFLNCIVQSFFLCAHEDCTFVLQTIIVGSIFVLLGKGVVLVYVGSYILSDIMSLGTCTERSWNKVASHKYPLSFASHNIQLRTIQACVLQRIVFVCG